MPAAQYRLVIEQGATLNQPFLFEGYDFTGWTFAGKIRKTYSSPTVLGTLAFAVTDTPTDGILFVKMSATASAALAVDPATSNLKKPTKVSYDIEGTLGGVVTRLLEGECWITPENTR